MTRHVKGFRVVTVVCKDRTDGARSYDAGISTDPIRCSKCGELVPVAGNEIHEVHDARRRRPEPRPHGDAGGAEP